MKAYNLQILSKHDIFFTLVKDIRYLRTTENKVLIWLNKETKRSLIQDLEKNDVLVLWELAPIHTV